MEEGKIVAEFNFLNEINNQTLVTVIAIESVIDQITETRISLDKNGQWIGEDYQVFSFSSAIN